MCISCIFAAGYFFTRRARGGWEEYCHLHGRKWSITLSLSQSLLGWNIPYSRNIRNTRTLQWEIEFIWRVFRSSNPWRSSQTIWSHFGRSNSKKNMKSRVKLETTNTILEEKFDEKLKVRAVQEKFQKPQGECSAHWVSSIGVTRCRDTWHLGRIVRRFGRGKCRILTYHKCITRRLLDYARKLQTGKVIQFLFVPHWFADWLWATYHQSHQVLTLKKITLDKEVLVCLVG